MCSKKVHDHPFFFLANDGSIVTLGNTNIIFDRTFLTFDSVIITLCNTNITCNYTFVTFSASFISLLHLMIQLSH